MPEGYRYDTGSFESLQHLIAAEPRRFSLNLAVCGDSSVRSALVIDLEANWRLIEEVSLWPYSADVFQHVHERMGAGPRDALFIFGLDDALLSSQPPDELLRNLNVSPPRWKAWFACPVVFWVDPQTEQVLRNRTRDFWEWVSGFYRLDRS